MISFAVCGVNYVDGGGGGVDDGDSGGGFLDLPDPTLEQSQCIIEKATPTVQQEIEDACGDLNTDADIVSYIANRITASQQLFLIFFTAPRSIPFLTPSLLSLLSPQ